MLTTDDGPSVEELVVLGCRVLAFRGLAEDILGHISARVSKTEMVVRCRGPRERGLLFTDREDVHLVAIDREGDDLPGSFNLPNETPIHREVLRARPDVNAVVHVHPPAVVAADLAGLELRPVIGAYNIPAMHMAAAGIPVYPRAVLISRAELGREVAQVLGDKQACVLRGHGIVTTGESVEQAVVCALNLDALARITLLAANTGAPLPEVSQEDMALLPDLGSSFNVAHVWRHNVTRLQHAGFG